MDLNTFLKRNPDISIFNPSDDNESVLELMAQSPMKVGGIELLYDRSPSFEALLKCQAPQYVTFLGKDRDNSLMGFFSMSFAKKWIFGEQVQCGYIGDFRTNRSRRAAVVWRKVYSEILQLVQKESHFSNPKYFLTAILKNNVEALRNLTSLKKDLGFYYHKLTDVDMVNVYGQFPWASKSKFKVSNATSADVDLVKTFLNDSESKKAFGAVFDESDNDCWAFREKTWPAFKIEKFLLIKDENEKILACSLPWDPGFAKRMTVRKAPVFLRFLFSLVKIFGLKMPKVGESLKTIYLTHLNFADSVQKNKAEIVISFLNHLMFANRYYHMISFADDSGISSMIKGFVIQKVPVSLFLVTTDSNFKFHNDTGSAMGFEMGLV